MRKSFQYKLYRSKRNRRLHQQIGVAANLYNHCIALHKRYYRMFGKSLHKYQLQKHLTKLKRLSKHSHWKLVGSQAIQDITDRIERAYRLFFDGLKEGRKVSPPRFRKRIKYRSYTLKQAGHKLLDGDKVKIGKTVFKYSKSREIEGEIKTLTVKRDLLGDIYLFFSCEVPDVENRETTTGEMAGFDFGLKTFMTCSEGDEIESPEFFKKNLKAIKQANRLLSKKQKGSNNRKKAKLNLVRVHKKVVNRRKDYHFKLAKQLAEQYDWLFFEDLDIKAMQRQWGRKISDLAFSDYIRIQKYYCEKRNTGIGFVDRYFPSSKRCSVCGHIHDALSLKDRSWICPQCKTEHNRDENASYNIKREGASSCGVGDISPPFEVAISA